MSKARWKDIPREEILNIIKESSSDRQVLEKLGYNPDGGGSHQMLKEIYKELDADVSHFTGQHWKKDLVDVTKYKYGTVLRNGQALRDLSILQGRKCQNCGLAEWNQQPITLEVHHIDGDHLNNSLENLILLCPNCHSQTSNYKIRNKRKEIDDEELLQALKEKKSIREALLSVGLTGSGGNYARAYSLMYSDSSILDKNLVKQTEFIDDRLEKTRRCACGNIIHSKTANQCRDCYNKSQQKVERPDREVLKELIRSESFCEIGKNFGVTDNAIRNGATVILYRGKRLK